MRRKGSIVNASCRVSLLACPSDMLPPNRAWDKVFERMDRESQSAEVSDAAQSVREKVVTTVSGNRRSWMQRSTPRENKGSVVTASCRVSLLASPSHLLPPNRAMSEVIERLLKEEGESESL